MAQTIVCANVVSALFFDKDGAIVHYSCRHVEHEDCCFDHHPHNMCALYVESARTPSCSTNEETSPGAPFGFQ